MQRQLYYTILLFAFGIAFVCGILLMFVPETRHFPPFRYFGYTKDLLALFILLSEMSYASARLKPACAFLLLLTFFGRCMIIMHWPFGFLIFMVSGLLLVVLLAVEVFRSHSEAGLKCLILLYPLTRLIFHRIFYYHLQIPWWIMDFVIMGLIPVTLAIRWIRSEKHTAPPVK